MKTYTKNERRILRHVWDDIILHLERFGAIDGLCSLLSDRLQNNLPLKRAEIGRLEYMMTCDTRDLDDAYFWPTHRWLLAEQYATPRIMAAMWMRETLRDSWPWPLVY